MAKPRLIHISDRAFEPNVPDYPTRPGDPPRDPRSYGETIWLCKREGSNGEKMLRSGLWRTGPCDFQFRFPGDETVHILDGSVTIETEDGVFELETGAIAWFPQGLRSRWIVPERLLEFFTVFDAQTS